MYLSTESTILLPGTKTFNIKGVLVLELLTENIEQQDSAGGSEVSSLTSY